jgi:hypothetical protein
VFSALLEYALVNYASRSDAQRLARRKQQKHSELSMAVTERHGGAFYPAQAARANCQGANLANWPPGDSKVRQQASLHQHEYTVLINKHLICAEFF